MNPESDADLEPDLDVIKKEEHAEAETPDVPGADVIALHGGEHLSDYPTPDAGFPAIVPAGQQFREIYKQAAEALVTMNDPPELFLRGGCAVALRKDEKSGSVVVKEHTSSSLTLRLSRVSNWYKLVSMSGEEGPERRRIAIQPDFAVVKALLDEAPEGLPPLLRIARCPYFTRHGRFISTPGYHAEEGTFIDPAAALDVPAVPPEPTPEDVAKARSIIMDDVLGDFRFANENGCDKAHIVALLLEPLVVELVNHRFPAHVIDAPAIGSGKTLLGNVHSIISTGQELRWMSWPSDRQEQAKSLFAALLSGTSLLGIDNVKSMVDCPALEAALTGAVTGRTLGRSVMAEIDTKGVSFVLTANNMTMSEDFRRRQVTTRIDTDTETPAERKVKFKHDDLAWWVRQNRAEIVWALALLVQNSLVNGAVFRKRKLASFERWSMIIGGILEAAGITGFLEDEETRLYADPAKAEFAEFVHEWVQHYEGKAMKAGELVDNVVAPKPSGSLVPPVEVSYLQEAMGDTKPGARARKLSKLLDHYMGNIFGDWKLVLGEPDAHAKVKRYRLKRRGEVTTDAPQPRPPPEEKTDAGDFTA